MSENEKEKRKLRRQAELLWRLVSTTAGVADLAEPMKRAEFHFERLSKRQRVTVAVIAKQLVEGFHAIEKEEEDRTEETRTEEAPTVAQTSAIEPDEVIPPSNAQTEEG